MSVINCQHCQFPVAKDADFCPHCGSKSPQPKEDPSQKWKGNMITIGLEALFWIAALIVCYLFATEIFHKIIP